MTGHRDCQYMALRDLIMCWHSTVTNTTTYQCREDLFHSMGCCNRLLLATVQAVLECEEGLAYGIRVRDFAVIYKGDVSHTPGLRTLEWASVGLGETYQQTACHVTAKSTSSKQETFSALNVT